MKQPPAVDEVSHGTPWSGVGKSQANILRWQQVVVDKAVRRARSGHGSAVIWLTGLSGAGKSTLANVLERQLHAQGARTYLLDGDNVRHGLNSDLGFSAQDRAENIRRLAEVARLMVDAGLIVIAAAISPFRSDRQRARSLFASGEFFEIFVDTPLAIAEQRDPKGLYAKARRGELRDFTGIDSPYERPEAPDITVDTTVISAEGAASVVVEYLRACGVLPGSELALPVESRK